MRAKLCILFVFVTLTIFSQSDELSNRKMNVGFSITPEFNSLIVGNLVGKENVTPKIGFSSGISFEFHVSERSTLRTGIAYGKKRYNHTHSKLIFGSDIDPQTGYISESKIESKVTFSELQIPLVYQYELNKNKFFVAGGIELIYPFSNNSERTIFYGNGFTENLSKSTNNEINFAPVLSFGYLLPVSQKLKLSIEPMVKFYLKEYIITESNLYNLGLKTTLLF
jgi:hypothetical protein